MSNAVVRVIDLYTLRLSDLTPLRIPLVSWCFPMGCRLYSLREILPVSASPMSYAVAAGCNPAAMLAIVLRASCRDRNTFWFKHASRNFPLKHSMCPLSVGFPGRENSICTPYSKAYVSKALPLNFGPLSTLIRCGNRP